MGCSVLVLQGLRAHHEIPHGTKGHGGAPRDMERHQGTPRGTKGHHSPCTVPVLAVPSENGEHQPTEDILI